MSIVTIANVLVMLYNLTTIFYYFFVKSLLPPHTWRVEILWIATGGSLAVSNGWIWGGW